MLSRKTVLTCYFYWITDYYQIKGKVNVKVVLKMKKIKEKTEKREKQSFKYFHLNDQEIEI